MPTYLVYRIQTITTTLRIKAASEDEAETLACGGEAEEVDYDNQTSYEVVEER